MIHPTEKLAAEAYAAWGQPCNKRRGNNYMNTELTDKSVQELDIDAGELDLLRAQSCLQKQELHTKVIEINTQLKSAILPKKEYHRLMSIRGGFVKDISLLDRQIAELKAQRMGVLTVRDVRNHQTFGASEISQLVALRDKWHGFSMEKENPQKARETAWKFSQELREILRSYFQVK